MKGVEDDVAGSWLATKRQLMAVNAEATSAGCTAVFPEHVLSSLLDEDAGHLVVPIMRNHPLGDGPVWLRCAVSVKLAGANQRVTTYMDLSPEQIESLERPNEHKLHRIVRALIEASPAVDLNTSSNPDRALGKGNEK